MNSNTLNTSAIFFTTLYLLSVNPEKSIFPCFNGIYYISFAEDTQHITLLFQPTCAMVVTVHRASVCVKMTNCERNRSR